MDNATINAKLNAIYAQINELLEETKGQKFDMEEVPNIAADLAFLQHITQDADDLMETTAFDMHLEDFQA